MNKLIELLNQYERKKEGLPEDFEDYVIWNVEGDDIIQGSIDPDARGYLKYYIISKDYGFIKWLVDNNKIEKNYKEGLPAITKNGFLLEGETALLMLLAISDTPIQDLCVWLK